MGNNKRLRRKTKVKKREKRIFARRKSLTK